MSKKILVINSSPADNNSVSRKMVSEFLNQYKSKNPNTEIIERDIAHNTPDFVDSDWLNAKFGSQDSLTQEQKEINQKTDDLVGEIMDADIILAGVPVYNLTIPANFKAYIDQIVVAGKTFKMTPQGPVGLVGGGKKLIIMASSGTPYQMLTDWGVNFHEPYIKGIFNFIGIKDIDIISASGRKAEQIEEEMKRVELEINKLIENI